MNGGTKESHNRTKILLREVVDKLLLTPLEFVVCEVIIDIDGDCFHRLVTS